MENKRTMTDEPAMAPEIKFEITNNMFVVVCVFKGGLYMYESMSTGIQLVRASA